MRLHSILLGCAAIAVLPTVAFATETDERPLVRAAVERSGPARQRASAEPDGKTLHQEHRGDAGFRHSPSRVHVDRHGPGGTRVDVRVGTPRYGARIRYETPVRCDFVRGHYTYRVRRVHIPGFYEKRVVPARYEQRWDPYRCAYVTVEVSPRKIIKTWIPERYERRRERVWVNGYWQCSVTTPHDHGRTHGHADGHVRVRPRGHARGHVVFGGHARFRH